jgi:DNA-binding response OmpR family regulator
MATARSLSVLIVDDYPDTGESVAELLRLFGHHARVASNGKQALRLAQSFAPDVVLLDIGLPDTDGYTVAGELCEMLGRRPLLIVVTGFSNTEWRSRVAGIDHHFVKPLDANVLKDLLERHAEKLADSRPLYSPA